MRHLPGLFLLSISLLCLACDKDQTQFLLTDELPTPDDIRTYLRQTMYNNVLILEVDSTIEREIPYWLLRMEDESVVYFKKEWLKSISLDPDQWRISFAFTDGIRQDALLLGDSIYVSDTSVVLNPFGTAPLTALVRSQMPLKGRFGVKVLGKGENGIAIEHKLAPFTASHDIPILGLYIDHENEIELTFMNEDGKFRASKRIQVRTEPLTVYLNPEILQNQLPPNDDGIFFISDRKLGFDQRGEVRWAYTGDARYLYRKLRNGNLVVATQNGALQYHSPAFEEISMMGQTVQRFEVPDYLHHEIREMPNGNFLVGSNSVTYTGALWDGKLQEDLIIEVDRQSGDIIKRWDLNTILDNERERADGLQNDDWLHLNSIDYNPKDRTILFSGRHQSVVGKIDYDDGKLRWILAHPAGWRPELQSYVLRPVHADGSSVDLTNNDFLPYFLHNPLELPNGNILLYDNGNFRNYYEDPNVPEESYSRAAEYKINEESRTVELVWTFDYNQQLFTTATGDVDYFPENGHRVIGFLNSSSETPKIIELDANDQMIFEVNLNFGSYYRCEKIMLYQGL